MKPKQQTGWSRQPQRDWDTLATSIAALILTSLIIIVLVATLP